MHQALKGLVRWRLPLGAMLLALGSVLAISLLARSDAPLVKHTLAICNPNRHLGLAVLLSAQYLRAKGTLLAIAAYAVIAPFVIGGLSWWFRREET